MMYQPETLWYNPECNLLVSHHYGIVTNDEDTIFIVTPWDLRESGFVLIGEV